ncbi:hypothetical protein EVAR_8732_1 [Eumeta japonica]|uniref:Uncharacterized protein n=1 Tax=Eumeta variegata TaxID=151549 RepID=A0A4C1XND7_EUMVA|nr:hypothetical protein EVAR_8732_1 [Eumeta japonica]
MFTPGRCQRIVTIALSSPAPHWASVEGFKIQAYHFETRVFKKYKIWQTMEARGNVFDSFASEVQIVSVLTKIGRSDRKKEKDIS